MPMTQAEYVSAAGMHCPNCNSGEVCAGSSCIGETVVLVSCSCITCGAVWEDRFELTGYDSLHLETESEDSDGCAG